MRLPKRALAAVLLGAIGLVCLRWSFTGTDLRAVWPAWTGLRPAWLAAAGLFVAVNVVLRGLRLASVRRGDLPLDLAWRAVALGYGTGALLPLGAGELAKIAILHRQGRLPAARAAASVSLDRLFDVAGLCAVSLWLLGAQLIPRESHRPLVLLLLSFGVILALAGLVAWNLDGCRALLHAWGTRLPGIRTPSRHLAEALGELALLRAPGPLTRLALLQCAVLLLDLAAVGCTLQAFPFATGLPVLASTLRVTAFLMVASALPLLPGSLGAHQAACILALGAFGVGRPAMLAFSFMAQAINLGILLAMAVAALTLHGVGFDRFKRMLRLEREAQPPD